VSVVLSALIVAALAQPTPRTSTQPAPQPPVPNVRHALPPSALLTFVQHTLKPGTSEDYEAIEAQVVRGYRRANVPLFWIALQSFTNRRDVLYLQMAESPAQAERAAASERNTLASRPDLARLQRRLAALVREHTSTLATHRDELISGRSSPDFSTMRGLRVTVFQVHPGREGEFIEAMRTADWRDPSWSVYEANQAPTFFLVVPLESLTKRHRVFSIPRALRHLRGVYTVPDTRVYVVKPMLSHVPQDFARGNSRFWKPAVAH
jgi:hypothetical protein